MTPPRTSTFTSQQRRSICLSCSRARCTRDFIPETETSKMLKGKKISMFDVEAEVAKAQWYNDLEAKFGRMLQGR